MKEEHDVIGKCLKRHNVRDINSTVKHLVEKQYDEREREMLVSIKEEGDYAAAVKYSAENQHDKRDVDITLENMKSIEATIEKDINVTVHQSPKRQCN